MIGELFEEALYGSARVEIEHLDGRRRRWPTADFQYSASTRHRARSNWPSRPAPRPCVETCSAACQAPGDGGRSCLPPETSASAATPQHCCAAS
ncbi:MULTISPECIES: hypothetical protein [Actinomadura]|uniref:Uncharacterized protein n=1 Tax=Actinomadura luteofluorescens TaxID=46163 RepID=A0A7Y9JKY7_9ACTN|nr:hypothetical protein [Actinomadura luteofluorescens]NYD52013.1 hypothetical protein [Actinomadura luteofluorescens]